MLREIKEKRKRIPQETPVKVLMSSIHEPIGFDIVKIGMERN